MATRIKYTEELKERVLKEIKDGAYIEDVSKRYEVPVVVIEEWQRRMRSDAYIDASFLNHKEVHTCMWTFIKGHFNLIVTWMKDRILLGGLLAGCLCIAVLSIAFYGHTEFSPTLEPKVDLAPKIDSLIIQGSKIEKSLSRQNDLSLSISNTVTNIHEAQKPKIIIRTPKKVTSVQKPCCCCMGVKCAHEYKCNKDSIR